MSPSAFVNMPGDRFERANRPTKPVRTANQPSQPAPSQRRASAEPSAEASPVRQFECDVSYIRRWLPYIPSITGYSPSLPDRSHTVVRRLLLPDTMNHSTQSDREIYSSVVNLIGEISLFLISVIRARPTRFTLEPSLNNDFVSGRPRESRILPNVSGATSFSILRYGTTTINDN